LRNNGTVGHVDFVMQYVPAMCRLISGTETKKRNDFLLVSRKFYSRYISIYKLRGLSPQGTLPTERPLHVGEVSANFCG
jgi:hypothetical protein